MKGIVRLSVIFSLCIGLSKQEAGMKDEQPKHQYSSNAINPTQKPDLLSYQQITHYSNKYPQVMYHQQYQPRTHVQQMQPYQQELLKNPIVVPPQQAPVAMVIIAQPAYVPLSMLQQSNVAQHLLNYFQGNSQARYNFVHAPYHQPQPTQQYAQPQPVHQYLHYQQPQREVAQYQPSAPTGSSVQTSSASFQSHEALPTPEALISHQPHHVVPHHLPDNALPEGRSVQYQSPLQQIQYQQQEQEYQKPVELTEISKLAQKAAQHFLMSGGLNGGSRTAPAIITGLEHFAPEQQEKIKAQLSAHFGAPLQPLNFAGQSGQKTGGTRQNVGSDKFVPSIEVKNGEITQGGQNENDKM